MIDPGPYLGKYKFIPIVTGPTASGKSAVAIELCRKAGGELVSADSMQIYRAPQRIRQRKGMRSLIT